MTLCKDAVLPPQLQVFLTMQLFSDNLQVSEFVFREAFNMCSNKALNH